MNQQETELLKNELDLSNVSITECELEPTQCILEPIIVGVVEKTENQKLLLTNVFRIKKINNEGIEKPFYKEGDIAVIPPSLKGATIPMSLKANNSKGKVVIKKFLLATTYDLKIKLSSYATLFGNK